MKGGKLIADSRDVAATFGKLHTHVIASVRDLLSKEPTLGETNFRSSSYLSVQSKELPCFNMDRDGFSLLAMGFTGEKALRSHQYVRM